VSEDSLTRSPGHRLTENCLRPPAFGLIDKDTPQEARAWTSLETGQQWELVFSDEFEVEGRSFFPGDDPYWEAVDLHYWSTNNLEWSVPFSSVRSQVLAVLLTELRIAGTIRGC
jgi:beta-glucanase (GH16 family)